MTIRTKTPWHAHLMGGSVDIHDPHDVLLCHIVNHTDSHYIIGDIVTAVNAHTALVTACEAFVEAWEKSRQLEKTDVAIRLARAALVKAGKETP